MHLLNLRDDNPLNRSYVDFSVNHHFQNGSLYRDLESEYAKHLSSIVTHIEAFHSGDKYSFQSQKSSDDQQKLF